MNYRLWEVLSLRLFSFVRHRFTYFFELVLFFRADTSSIFFFNLHNGYALLYTVGLTGQIWNLKEVRFLKEGISTHENSKRTWRARGSSRTWISNWDKRLECGRASALTVSIEETSETPQVTWWPLSQFISVEHEPHLKFLFSWQLFLNIGFFECLVSTSHKFFMDYST